MITSTATTQDLAYRPATYWGPPGDAGGAQAEIDEVEIARITVQSASGDAIVVLARPGRGRTHYRIEDGYDRRFRCTPDRSESPLTMAELIILIDTARSTPDGAVGLTSVFRDANLAWGASPESLVDLVRVTSAFYPELEAHYAAEARTWVAQAQHADAPGVAEPRPTASLLGLRRRPA